LTTLIHPIDANFTYDGFLETLDAIEDDRLENYSNPQELAQLKSWIATIASEGADVEDQVVLKEDIQELLSSHEGYEYAYGFERDYIYLSDGGRLIPCSWAGKQWKHVKKFVKKHKKALIIGAIAIAATATVIGFVAAAPAAAAVAGSAAASPSEKSHEQVPSTPTESNSSLSYEFPHLTRVFEAQKTAFKETIKHEEFLPNSSSAIWGDLGKAIDTNLARNNYYDLMHRMSADPDIMNEIRRMNFTEYRERTHQFYPGPVVPEVRKRYAEAYQSAEPEYRFDTALYQACGEVALAHNLPQEAIRSFNRAIDKSPANAFLYLERGKAHFDEGNYEASIQDFQHFTKHNPTSHSSSLPEMTLHFTRGLMKGTARSGSQMCLLVADLVRHPIQTTSQMYEGFKTFAGLAMTAEWDALAETLVPEARELVKDWPHLSDARKCELSGYILGKHGADILLPGAAAKVIARGVKGAKEFASACRHIRAAEQTLALESVTGAQSSVNAAEILTANKKTLELGETLGFSTEEMAGLKQAGTLEATIAEVDATVYNSPAFLASKTHFDKVQAFLKQFKGYRPEAEVRELIHRTGTPTFPRPPGIPENYRVQLSDRGAGMKYVHPLDEGTGIRVMPGKPHSMRPAQRNSYVICSKQGKVYDKIGNVVLKDSEEAHIPYNEFVYIE
jgi:tetratricopeptide (TPR) repeat protein